LKRTSFQLTPSAAFCVLSNALGWLTAALAGENEGIGAEEILQFFVFTVCCAGIRCLPAFVRFVDQFVDAGLRQTKFGYLLTQLHCCIDFVEQRLLPVLPFFIFPFTEVPEHFAGKLVAGDSLVMRGFAVWAFPTFHPDYHLLFPAMLSYTGNDNDVAICTQFQIIASIDPLPQCIKELPTIPTRRGSLLHLAEKDIEECRMISVDVGNFDDRIEDIRAFSAMMKMMEIGKHRTLSNIVNFYAILREKWFLRSPNYVVAIKTVISEVQRALILLDTRHRVTTHGIMDAATVAAIEEVACLCQGAVFTHEIFADIVARLSAH
jgi:hypothetical protein